MIAENNVYKAVILFWNMNSFISEEKGVRILSELQRRKIRLCFMAYKKLSRNLSENKTNFEYGMFKGNKHWNRGKLKLSKVIHFSFSIKKILAQHPSEVLHQKENV